MSWSQKSVGDWKVQIFDSASPVTAAVIWLHDLDGRTLKDFPRVTELFAQQGLALICPQPPVPWWLETGRPEIDTRLASVGKLATDLLPLIQARWQLSPPRIGVGGCGVGGQGALLAAYRKARLFPVVAAVCPAVDLQLFYGQETILDELFPSAEALRQQTATLHMHPLDWPPQQLLLSDSASPWFEGCDRLVSKLTSIGIPFEADLSTTTGGDQDLYFLKQADRVVKFFSDQLRAPQMPGLRIVPAAGFAIL